MVNTRILIVEDNEDNMILIVDILESMGYTTLKATDGQAGIDQAKSEKPDLILMDLSLPRVDGWEATKQIKAESELAQIPIIALTAHAMVGDRERAIEAGCDDYITKPINLAELIKKLKRYLKE